MAFGFIEQIIALIQGDIARFIAVGVIAATGCMLAFGETQGIMKRGMQACFGISVIVGCVSIASSLFGV